MGKNLLSDTDYTRGRDNRFKSMIMIGKVVSIECTKLAANIRVLIPDKIDRMGKPLITKPIPVLQAGASQKQNYSIPRIGTNVLLAKLPNGSTDYMVLGCFYSTNDPPPVTDPNLDYVKYDDGSFIQFDAGNGTMTWNLKGGISFQSVGDITLKSSGTILLDAPTVHLKGAMNFEGNITHTGNITTSGKHTDSSGHHTASEREQPTGKEDVELKSKST